MAGLYVHIPFCRSKCAYCDFYSSPRQADTDGYIDAILGEFDLRADEISERYTTLYIGGGTPSILSPQSLDRLLTGINRRADLSGMKEVTIEGNPEDITQESLSLYANLGINRVSIGVQSFNDASLSAIGRRHSSQAAYKALDALASSGMNYNADLIYGQPGQSMEMWERDLEQMLHFSPPHLSAYLLSYEPGTRLYAMLANGRITGHRHVPAVVRTYGEKWLRPLRNLQFRQSGKAGGAQFPILELYTLPRPGSIRTQFRRKDSAHESL